jgi:hypothetical protein
MSDEEKSKKKERKKQLEGWLSGQDFYNLMQVYRTMPISNQLQVVRAFEAVQKAVREKVAEIYDGKPDDYITVYESVGGWKAVQMTWSTYPDIPHGFWEPEQTGVGAYDTMEQACVEGRAWAASEELEFKEPKQES